MEDLRRGGHSKYDGKVKPFGKHFFTLLLHELRPVFKDTRFFRVIWLGFINLSCLLLLLSWCHSSKSLGLRSFTYIVFFDTLSLFICALRIWVEQKKPNSQYTFGYERFEVLAIFLSTAFSFISSLFLIKKSIERWIFPIPIRIGRFTSGILLAFFCHIIVTYWMKNKGLNLVVCASSTSILQKRLTSLSQNFCTNVPGLSTKVTPRFNPFMVIGWGACAILLLAQLLIDMYDYDGADCFAAICIAVMTCVVMFPLCSYSAKILLQGTPSHITALLEKSLREASTLDGVLEFRNEHFWLLGYDKIVGSVHVRIRRDANEQSVLTHLMSKLSSLVPDITIQVFKDEWAWSSSTLQILNESFKKFPPASSFSSSSANLKTPGISEKSGLASYSSTMPANNYSKLLYSTPSLASPESSSFKQLPAFQLPAAPSVPKQTQNESCSVEISGVEPSSSDSATTRSTHMANMSRVPRTESNPVDSINASPNNVGTTDYTSSYNS